MLGAVYRRGAVHLIGGRSHLSQAEIRRRRPGQWIGAQVSMSMLCECLPRRLAKGVQKVRAQRGRQIAGRQLRDHPVGVGVSEDHCVAGHSDHACVPVRRLRQDQDAAVRRGELAVRRRFEQGS